jgi:hypothetical protein
VADSFNPGAIMQDCTGVWADCRVIDTATHRKQAMIVDMKTKKAKSAAHKQAPACGCFGFTSGDLAPRRGSEIDAQLFARCYSDSYLITATRQLRKSKDAA